VEKVNDFEAGFHRVPVHAGDSGQSVEALLVPQEAADLDDLRGVDEKGRLPAMQLPTQDGGADSLL
jgi:hypothetical protein